MVPLYNLTNTVITYGNEDFKVKKVKLNSWLKQNNDYFKVVVQERLFFIDLANFYNEINSEEAFFGAISQINSRIESHNNKVAGLENEFISELKLIYNDLENKLKAQNKEKVLLRKLEEFLDYENYFKFSSKDRVTSMCHVIRDVLHYMSFMKIPGHESHCNLNHDSQRRAAQWIVIDQHEKFLRQKEQLLLNHESSIEKAYTYLSEVHLTIHLKNETLIKADNFIAGLNEKLKANHTTFEDRQDFIKYSNLGSVRFLLDEMDYVLNPDKYPTDNDKLLSTNYFNKEDFLRHQRKVSNFFLEYLLSPKVNLPVTSKSIPFSIPGLDLYKHEKMIVYSGAGGETVKKFKSNNAIPFTLLLPLTQAYSGTMPIKVSYSKIIDSINASSRVNKSAAYYANHSRRIRQYLIDIRTKYDLPFEKQELYMDGENVCLDIKK